MKVVVCIKQVIDPESRLKLDPQTDSIDESIIGYIVNPADMYAIEEALRIRDTFSEGEVIVLTMGPPRARRVLIDSLARGVDNAIHIWDNSLKGSDNHVTSMVLAKAIGLVGYDLIICGRQAIDDNNQQVPAAIAELLGLPFASAVTKIDIRPLDKKAIIHRSLGRGDCEIVECNLPGLFSVEEGINKPRYAKVRSRLRAEKREIATWNCDALGFSPSEVGQDGSMIKVSNISYPKPRAKKVAAPDPNLPPHLRLQWLIQGGNIQEKSNLLQGSPEEASSRVVQLLTEEKIISPGYSKR